ncbi:MAG TPA: Abi family protein [Candidatus Onthousia faecavium]|mgnify:CR=1 FL=1|nr:Abi family protein [Candidatus Onthousia faecavium]
MIDKKFKNLEEQIEILKYKGMTITDEEYAKKILLRENYFFLSGYRYPLMRSMTDKHFLPGVTFEELYSLFLFDREIRNIFFKNLLIIENNLKSIFSYQLSKKYGYKEKTYLKSRNFTKDKNKQKQVNDLIKKMKRQIRINGSQHSATAHYMSNYGYIPLWILVKVLSFGIVGELFSIMKYDDQISICKMYNISLEDFSTYLPILSNYRNLCAHEDILYENKTQKHIKGTFYHQILNIKKSDEGEYVKGINDLFALVIIMKRMLSYDEFKNMSLELDKKIENLSYNLHSIKIENILDRMGFPSNYMQLANIERSSIDEK